MPRARKLPTILGYEIKPSPFKVRCKFHSEVAIEVLLRRL